MPHEGYSTVRRPIPPPRREEDGGAGSIREERPLFNLTTYHPVDSSHDHPPCKENRRAFNLVKQLPGKQASARRSGETATHEGSILNFEIFTCIHFPPTPVFWQLLTASCLSPRIATYSLRNQRRALRSGRHR